MKNLNKFMECYEKNLRDALNTNPEKFIWYPRMDITTFINKVRFNIENNSLDKTGPVMQKTMKDLGIRNTYVALRNYLE